METDKLDLGKRWCVADKKNINAVVPEFTIPRIGHTVCANRKHALAYAMNIVSDRKDDCARHMNWLQKEWEK